MDLVQFLAFLKHPLQRKARNATEPDQQIIFSFYTAVAHPVGETLLYDVIFHAILGMYSKNNVTHSPLLTLCTFIPLFRDSKVFYSILFKSVYPLFDSFVAQVLTPDEREKMGQQKSPVFLFVVLHDTELIEGASACAS